MRLKPTPLEAASGSSLLSPVFFDTPLAPYNGFTPSLPPRSLPRAPVSTYFLLTVPWVTHGSRVLQPESRANALRHPRLMFNLDNWGQLGKLHRHTGQNAMLATALVTSLGTFGQVEYV